MRARVTTAAVLAVGLVSLAGAASAGRPRISEPVGFQLFESPQVNPLAISADGSEVYVAHTTANVVGVINTALNWEVTTIPVGVDPVSVALRPGVNELWVSNHVSDTVSVIDVDPNSPTRYRVIDTIQSIDANKVTQFDEPVGIAFTADGTRAFVALSSRNQIAVIDANARTVTGSINVKAQEPRAIAVRNGLLYVAAFESGNQTQLSGCASGSTLPAAPPNPAEACTLHPNPDLVNFATNPNLPGRTKNIALDGAIPDRDLFVYDVSTLAQKGVVTGMGTLLYGVAVSSSGRAFVTATDARNHVNGLNGQVLAGLGNRTFNNRVAAATCTSTGCGTATIQDLEPGTPTQATALATPYGVALSGDDSTLFVTAAGSSRLATLRASDLSLRWATDLGTGPTLHVQIPRGLAVLSDGNGKPLTAYVLNTLDNSVAVVNVTNSNPPSGTGTAPSVTATIALSGDKTPAAVRRGRIVFNSAFASTSGTFSCASCHPDGNTDQLLWRIGGACQLSGCTGDEPRTTMPVRGLKNTLPLHWDGTLGDPFGGGNGAVGLNGSGGTDCTLTQGPGGDHACFRDLINASNSGVMCDQSGSCPAGGLLLTEQQKDDEATYLANVSYPPARSRRMDDTLSTPASPVPVPNGDGSASSTTASALKGFKDFFTDQGGLGNLVGNPDTCADSDAGCHQLPLTNGTNSQTLNGFDVPTMRGLTDRFVQFSLAPTAPEGILTQANSSTQITVQGVNVNVSALEAPIQWDPTQGFREITTFGAAFLIFQPVYGTRPLNMFQMFEEANSMGFSGAQARQVELNVRTTSGANLTDVNNWLTVLETADKNGLVNLRADGVRNGFQVGLSFANNTYTEDYGSYSLTRAQLIGEAQAGTTTVTLTAALRPNWGTDNGPQPLLGLATTGTNGVTGDPPIPVIASGSASNPPPITLVGTDVRSDATLFIDGAPITGTLSCLAGTNGAFCVNGNVSIDLNPSLSLSLGLHLLQVQNPAGPLSEELPICVGAKANCNS